MNYKLIYESIIKYAKKENENGNRSIGYFEKHHIFPKSLGGIDNEENLVKLTAREHFICHWLLVKMFNKGTNKRNKMLYAFWRMKSNPTKTCERYTNSRAYEKLRIEYSKIVCERMKILQLGNKNSQFGKKWFTNYETGESKSFKEKPNEKWIEGRNLYKGQTSNLLKRQISKFNHTNEHILKIKEIKLEEAKQIWDDYHSNTYNNIRDYCRKNNLSHQTVSRLLSCYIPNYSKIFKAKSKNNSSNKKYVGKYNSEP